MVHKRVAWCYRSLKQFKRYQGSVIFSNVATEDQMLEVLKEAGMDNRWIGIVRDERIRFFHRTAPWIALEVDSTCPFQSKLIVMKENLSSFDDGSKYMRLNEIAAIVQGLAAALVHVQQWLIDQVTSFEQKESASQS